MVSKKCCYCCCLLQLKGLNLVFFSGENWQNGKKGGDSGQYQNRNWAMANFEEEQMVIPSQMTPGKTGRQVELLSNYYKITISDVVVEHYDVEITKAKNERAGTGPLVRPPAPSGVPDDLSPSPPRPPACSGDQIWSVNRGSTRATSPVYRVAKVTLRGGSE